MHLGFHYHVPADQRNGKIWLPGYLGRFLDGIAAQCEHLTCFMHSPRQSEMAQMDYQIESPNLELVSIGLHGSVPSRVFRSGRITQPLWERRGKLDAVLLRGPSPLLPQMALAAGKTPLALLLVGDYLAGVDDLPQPQWRKELIRVWSAWNKRGQDAVARRALTFVNSRKLFSEYQPIAAKLVETRTTTLTEADFYQREDTCQSHPIRILYTGRMDRAKGLLLLVQAVAMLKEDVVLDLVGWALNGDTILEEISRLSHELGIANRVVYHGYHPVGPQLFEFYKQADIYVLGSTSSFEGFPRTIWEAMAHSLPVVATRVGSIPEFITGAAELVNPRDVDALAEGMMNLIKFPGLRQSIIKKGIGLAKQVTLEALIPQMVEDIQLWINNG